MTDGTVVTFYSFKGGVGRTMALANIAFLLAQRGKRVLMVDWDLEAPGLHLYFAESFGVDIQSAGLLDLLVLAAASSSDGAGAVGWVNYLQKLRLPGRGELHVMTAGRQDAGYALKLQRLDWNDLFANRGMGAMIEAMRDEWKEEYDFVFIDSRTGFTDAGGVCTVQLPDVVVAVFTANAQSLDGACLAVERAQVGRQLLEYDRSSLIVLPLLSRFDGRAEVDDARAWVDRVARRVAPFYESWLSTGTPYRQVVERTKVPHVPKFSFGERLPVTVESVTDPDTMAFAYSLSAEILSAQFNEVERLILGTLPAYDLASSQRDLDEVYADLERRLEALPRSSTVLVAEAGAAGVAATVYGFYVATRSAALLAVGTAIGTAAVTFGWEAYRLSRERRAQVRRMGNRMREARVLHAHSPERQRTTLEALSQELASLEDGT